MEEFHPFNALPLNALPLTSQSLWRTPLVKLPMESNLELVIGIYRAEETSNWVLKSLGRLQRERAIALVSTAVLVKTEAGHLQPRQIVDWNLAEGGLIDGLTAALVSLFSPRGELGAIAFQSGGLAVEILVDNLLEVGLTQAELTAFSTQIQPQSSVLIALTKRAWLKRLMLEMAHTDAALIHTSMTTPLRGSLGEHLINLAQAVTLENSRNPYLM